jgi:glucose/arabinose dehydrogenase
MATQPAGHVEITETPDGWYVVITDADNAVVRTAGSRITVALTPDGDDGSPGTPLDVTLAPSQ